MKRPEWILRETVLALHEQLLAEFGEAGVAIVVPKRGETLDAAKIQALLKTKIANFKVPKLVVIAESLPRNTMGKVQKNLLREQYKNSLQ